MQRLTKSAPRKSSMAPPSCFCDRPSKLMTAWRDANPGRSKIRTGACVFWRWFDPPICPRSRQIIPGLLRRIKELKDQLRGLKLQDQGM
ncbi:hypothetical protein TIFTF001_028097 [Ficus carica]|uniref:Uncharacterized protein n=1 Tax=Ficus carica TaxID=3494 RepID=A0AA88DP69_FICCA|nr:hypothetical protein TIFTF001_028097 [Ficus carica]